MSTRRALYKGYAGRKRGRDSSDSKVLSESPLKDVTVEPASLPSDTSAALIYLKGIFPRNKLPFELPPIILKHQIYSLIRSKTDVDRDIIRLRDNGEVLFFKFSTGMDEYGVVYTSDYRAHLMNCLKNDEIRKIALHFVDHVLLHIKDVSLDREVAVNTYGLADESITDLMNAGILLRRDVGSWWISIPGSAQYMKHLSKGRKAILRLVKLRKYKEIPQSELESRNLSVHSKLGTLYHLHDILGAELVTKITTTTGTLIRYIDLSKQVKRKKQLAR